MNADALDGRTAALRAITLTLFALLAVTAHANGAWDVTDTGQPYRDVQFTVTEGTWMSVSVSPDGNRLAFDLLGDIYTLPSAGGEATPVLSGPPMQRMPVFSRDGRRLLYMSDVSGEDNIWVSNIDGSDARQVSHEIVNLLTAPAWGADEQSAAATWSADTFEAMRSSEIRLYDFRGGAGEVLVPIPSSGRDVGEAQLSADGRYLYYTEKITTPNIFVDANHINHVIERRNLENGTTERLLSGFGGAIAPQLSPDGSRLAFIRRVKDKTVLFVYDTRTAEQRPIYDGLDRDAQSDFMPHGAYYPRYGWFPDNRRIAIWAEGRIHEIDVEAGTAKEIPFRAVSRHRITTPNRIAHDLAPAHFSVRAIDHITVSPDARRLAFTALGHLWGKALPAGVPQRLSKTWAFEIDPVFAPNGHALAYVTWDDERGSSLELIVGKARSPRTLLRSRGVIREPTFSADGRKLAYRIDAGDKRLGGYQAKPGLYWLDLADGASHFVTRAGETPRFSPDGLRLYYTEISADSGNPHFPDQQSATRLVSTDLQGLDRRTHALGTGTDVLEFKISPDMRWIAFKDRQQYYVLPYRETGSPLTLSADVDTVPVTRLTRNGGYALTWAADSKRVRWMLGESLYEVAVRPDLSGDAIPDRPAFSVGLEIGADVPRGSIAFVGGRIITMEGDQVIERGTVLVEGNRIVAVGSSEQVTVPKGAKVIDVAGKTLMPGLIDMHGHIDCCHAGAPMPQKQAMRYAALAFGVTTNFDPYSSDLPNYALNEMNLAGVTVGPRSIGSGRVAYGRAGTPGAAYVPVESYDDARAFMMCKLQMGGTFVKSYRQELRRQRQQLVKAGREAGVMVDVEGGSHFYNNITEIIDGHTNLEHSLPVANYYDDIVQLMARGGVSNTPTLVVAFGELFGENYLYQTTRAWDEPKVRMYVQETTSDHSPLNVASAAPPHVRGMTSIHAADELWDIGFRSVARSVKKLDDAGVIINAGSHGQVAGLAMHWEMWLLAEGGMSKLRVLRAATLNGARTLALDSQIGSLSPGKLADLIVLDRNPLDDIHDTDSVRYSMVNGRLYDSLTMNEIGNYDRPRGRFYWELDGHGDIDWSEAWGHE